jgi:hypothetical protein
VGTIQWSNFCQARTAIFVYHHGMAHGTSMRL